MSRQFVPLYYDQNIQDWLTLRFPGIEAAIILDVGHNVYHVLVSASDANAIRTFVTKDLNPPFARRTFDPRGTPLPKFEAGLCFDYYNTEWSIEVLRGTVAAYKSVLPKLTALDDRNYVQGQIASLEARL